MNKPTSSDRPATRRDLRELNELFREAKTLIANDSAPRRPRSQREIITGMISAIDAGLPAKRRKAAAADNDLIATMPRARRPQNPLRAADSFHRAPVGMLPRRSVLVSFDAAVKAAGAKMRSAYRPASA